MSPSVSAIVHGKDGLRGVIEKVPQPLQGSEPQVLVRVTDGRQVLVPAPSLVLQDDGSYYLPLSLAELERQRSTSGYQSGDTVVVPVIAEELDVRKRTVETGRVRITKVVREREELVDEPLLREEVFVERVPVNRIVEGTVGVRYENGAMIVPLVEEVLVVEKRLMLKEELHITKRKFTEKQAQTITLRSEEAMVERIKAQEQPEAEEADDD
jgi:uncharacterized protein (TIGR02271 family)